MARTIVITQPTYFPWTGYFEQLRGADVFVVLDSVQFEAQSWQCRNRLRGVNGETFWLTVPVASHPLDTPLKDVRISRDRPKWRVNHLKSIQGALGRGPFFKETFPLFEQWLATDYERLVDLNVAGIQCVADLLGIQTEWVNASELPVGGTKGDLVLNICRHLGATTYKANAGSRDYLEPMIPQFREHGIEIVFQDWPHPVYPQRGEGFVSHMAVVDALANVGAAEVRRMIGVQT